MRALLMRSGVVDYRREKIGQGLAAAMLLGSLGGQGQRSGFSAKDLKLACSRPGLNWNYTDGALLELENRSFYLHSTAAGSLGKRYWFGTKPTLNKLVVQYRQQVAREGFDKEILEALMGQIRKEILGGATWRILVNPEADLPEQKSLTLLILPPALGWGEDETGREAVKKRILELSARCGGRERLYRNTLVFLAVTPRGLGRLRQAHRERAALDGVRSDYGDQLDDDQKQDLRKRLEVAAKATLEALGPAYTVALRVHGQEVGACALADARPSFQDHLGYAWTTLVEDEEWILRRVGSVTLQKTGLTPKEGGLRLKDAVDAFLRFTDKPMISSKDAVISGLARACRDGLIGIGRGASPSTVQARYCKQEVSLDPNEDGLWITPPFEPESPKEPAKEGDRVTPTVEDTKVTAEKEVGEEGPEKAARTIRRFVVHGSVPVENYGELFRCFVGPAARMNLKRLNLGIQFEMQLPEDQGLDANDATVKAMKETARQLGLAFEVEE